MKTVEQNESGPV